MLKSPRLRQKKILVIGGTGFIGSHLVKHLIANDAKVTIIYGSKNKVGYNISQHSIDILNFKEVDKILKKEFDFIYQCIITRHVQS
ncbi:MAG: NAD-dependent epimerase/dehydratase family protein [Bacteroidetes bacterium]|nr:MAG: NAD-dependent epimerase/dehydratase family protein [Bacteroidota bacterium]